MSEQADGAGQFEEITLRPVVTVAEPGDAARARALHDQVGDYCFIARSLNFPIHHVVTILT